ncbi:MAG: hypothetical protein IPK52_14050 [Chloroflexi bacterium]|nr:hypothetical protein [Chloroflexota bacterium]
MSLDAHTLLERHINARGGLRAILRITTLHQSGTVTDRRGTVVEIEGWRKRPDLLRIHFRTAESDGCEGWDGQRAWEHFPSAGTSAVYVDGLASDALRRASEFDGPLIQAAEKGHTVQPLGECVVAGLPVYGLRVVLRDGNIINHYLHKESYMIAATDSVRPVHAKDPSLTTTLYTDYRLVNGVMFSHYSVEVANDGAHNETFAWRALSANMPLEESFFALPAAVAPVENRQNLR